jgi:hypothetical protein
VFKQDPLIIIFTAFLSRWTLSRLFKKFFLKKKSTPERFYLRVFDRSLWQLRILFAGLLFCNTPMLSCSGSIRSSFYVSLQVWFAPQFREVFLCRIDGELKSSSSRSSGVGLLQVSFRLSESEALPYEPLSSVFYLTAKDGLVDS